MFVLTQSLGPREDATTRRGLWDCKGFFLLRAHLYAWGSSEGKEILAGDSRKTSNPENGKTVTDSNVSNTPAQAVAGNWGSASAFFMIQMRFLDYIVEKKTRIAINISSCPLLLTQWTKKRYLMPGWGPAFIWPKGNIRYWSTFPLGSEHMSILF